MADHYYVHADGCPHVGSDESARVETDRDSRCLSCGYQLYPPKLDDRSLIGSLTTIRVQRTSIMHIGETEARRV